MSQNHLLVNAAFKKPIERTPVWVMRQAGRYLPEYRAVRKQAGGFLEMCFNHEWAAEVSIQPYEIIGVDAIIMFSDILTPLIGMGMDLEFTPGPKFNNPIKDERDIDALKLPDPDENTPYVGKTLDLIHKEIKGAVPVIGFAGAPFTLASYMVEGETSKSFLKIKELCYNHEAVYRKLMDKLTRMTIDYLNYQIDHGAQMVQLFDTWAGSFSRDDYQALVFPYVEQIFSQLKGKGTVPKVYYINGGQHLLEDMAVTGADMVGLDWRTDLSYAQDLIGNKVALQGNLDPAILLGGKDLIRQNVRTILDKFNGDTGHVFNLGHGIDKTVNPEHLKAMVAEVKAYSKKGE
jgi:uroporphyrinogen decarboxylase